PHSFPTRRSSDLKIPAESPLQGKTIEEAGLRALDTVFLIHAQRQKHIIAVGPGFIMEAGDILTFRGEHRQVHKIASAKKLIPAVPGKDKKAKALPLFEIGR